MTQTQDNDPSLLVNWDSEQLWDFDHFFCWDNSSTNDVIRNVPRNFLNTSPTIVFYTSGSIGVVEGVAGAKGRGKKEEEEEGTGVQEEEKEEEKEEKEEKEEE